MPAVETQLPDGASARWLSRFAKGVVAATFALLFVGGLVTSWHAGMAVPDWPLSFGSLNPAGWWGNLPVRLEHGHRLLASGVGLLVTVLCAWVWRNGWPLLVALMISAGLSFLGRLAGFPPVFLMHISIWSFAGVFAVALFGMSGVEAARSSRLARKLAFAAFLGVCLQATLGGLRVTLETAGNLPAAMSLRILHGCVAQLELCLLAALAVVLSPLWRKGLTLLVPRLPTLRWLSWTVVAALYVQIAFGAAMRHLGAGLAIPTFPYATLTGGLFPAAHSGPVDLNFTHTRVGALAVTFLILIFAAAVLRLAHGEKLLARPVYALLGLLVVQCLLGVYVVWHAKPITLTTFHVVNGAALLATSLLIAMRISRLSYFQNASCSTSSSPREEEAVS